MNFHLSNQIMLYIKNQTGTPLLGHEIVIIEMHNVRQQLQANADLGKCTLNTQVCYQISTGYHFITRDGSGLKRNWQDFFLFV